jgi:hypothetical protein
LRRLASACARKSYEERVAQTRQSVPTRRVFGASGTPQRAHSRGGAARSRSERVISLPFTRLTLPNAASHRFDRGTCAPNDEGRSRAPILCGTVRTVDHIGCACSLARPKERALEGRHPQRDRPFHRPAPRAAADTGRTWSASARPARTGSGSPYGGFIRRRLPHGTTGDSAALATGTQARPTGIRRCPGLRHARRRGRARARRRGQAI